MSKLAASNKIFSLAKLASHTHVPLYRNAYALMLNTTATAGLGSIFWVIAARYYAPDIVGLNAAIISAMTFLSGVALLNLMSAMIRFIPRAGRATGQLVRYGYLISLAVSAAISLIVVFFGNRSPFFNFVGADPTFNLWFVLATTASCIFALQDSVLNGLRASIWIPIENITYAFAKIVLLIVLATTFPQHGIFASWTIPMIVALLPINFLIFYRLIPGHMRETQDQAEPVLLKQIARYVAGEYLGSFLSLATVRLLPLIVTYRLGPSANAYFFLPWIIVIALKLISTNMTTSLTVEGARDQTNFAKQSYRFLKLMALLYIPIVAILLLGAPYVLRLSGGGYAAEGTMLLRLLALSALPNLISTYYIGVARVQKHVIGIIFVRGLNAASVLVLSYILLPIYDITGVGIALVIGETLVAMLVMYPILKMRTAKRKIL